MEPFITGYKHNCFPGTTYDSPSRRPDFLARLFPTLFFYWRIFFGTTQWFVKRAKQNKADDVTWLYASNWILEIMEKTGMRIHVSGLDAFDTFKGPCVIVGNHMSTLETFLLPSMILPRRQLTFVVKRGLVEMPIFRHIMCSRNPVVVDRQNARQDLSTVLTEGQKRLKRGISVVVFPQSTRMRYFDEKHFNTIGVKLARKAGVPIVPLALKTDAWGQGKHIKELGKISCAHDVLFRFFPAMRIANTGHAEHAAITLMLRQTLDYWEKRQNEIDEGETVLPYFDPNFRLPNTQREYGSKNKQEKEKL